MNISQAEVLSHEYIQKFECNMKYLLFVNSQGKNTQKPRLSKAFPKLWPNHGNQENQDRRFDVFASGPIHNTEVIQGCS